MGVGAGTGVGDVVVLAAPTPASATVCVELSVASVKVRDPAAAPATVGLKWMVKVHFEPTETTLEQSLLSVKGPVMEMLAMRGLAEGGVELAIGLPATVTVTLFTALPPAPVQLSE